VTDDKDRLLLNTLLERCFCPAVVEDPNYQLSSSGAYTAGFVDLIILRMLLPFGDGGSKPAQLKRCVQNLQAVHTLNPWWK